MPQLTAIDIGNEKTPETALTFVPKDISDGVATVVASTGVPIGDKRVTVSVKRGANGRYKARLTLAFPVMETQTINGIDSPKIVRTAYADVTFTFDETSTESERSDLVGFLRSALRPNLAMVTDTVVKLQSVY